MFPAALFVQSESSMPDQKRQPLNVINPNDKVQQLRQAFAAEPSPRHPADEPVVAGDDSVLRDKVIDAIKTVYDPEIPVNIYDLGLIYDIKINAENRVTITMTLTAPGCPVAGEIVAEVERKVESVDEVTSATIDLVFEPQWTKERMSEAALLELGLL
jgi:FeS assembly SUF system protein